MASFEDTKAKAKPFLDSKFPNAKPPVGETFLAFIEEEELDSIDEIVEDITDLSSSTIVEHVGDECGVSKSAFFHQLRILFELEREQSTLNVLNGVKNGGAQNSKQNIFGMETVNVLNIDWTGHTADDIKEAREYINKQCGNAISDFDQAFITLETIGRRHGINLVPLMHDIYSFYKFKDLTDSERYNMTHSQFCAKSKTLKSLKFKDEAHKQVYQSLVQTLASFQHRLAPAFRVNNPLKIDDDINPYIQYTLNVSNMLKKILNTQQPSPLPLLVDLWIIPLRVKEALLSSADDDDEEDSDDDESDSDDEDEKIDTMTKDFTPNLKKYGAIYETATLDNNGDLKDVRTLETVFKKILNKSRRSIKLNIIIDRRKQKDNLLIYQLPLKYAAIPRNYCNETMIFLTSQHVMYDIDNSILKRDKKTLQQQTDKDPIFGAKYGCDGKMFLLSFGLHEKQIRISFWKNGGGVRFWPNYMITMWPRLFINAKINKEYQMNNYIENNFGLKWKDEEFTNWYNAIVDFDK